MDLKEFLSTCSGMALDGNSRAVVNIRYAEITYGNIRKDLRVLKDFSTIIPIVNVEFINDFAYIDLIFKNKYEKDLQEIWNILQDYKKSLEKLDKDTNKFPIVTVSIIPRDNANKYIMASAPIQFPLCLTDLSSNQLMISMLFQEKDVAIEY